MYEKARGLSDEDWVRVWKFAESKMQSEDEKEKRAQRCGREEGGKVKHLEGRGCVWYSRRKVPVKKGVGTSMRQQPGVEETRRKQGRKNSGAPRISGKGEVG